MDIEFSEILKKVKKKNIIPRSLLFIAGLFLLAINYNIFVIPNNFNIGGTSGLAIIFKQLFNIKPSLFIMISSIFLLTISFFTLGKEQTMCSIVGALLYPALIAITEPLANILIAYFTFSNILITIIICGSIFGIGEGIIYKAGFTTGGGDIIMQILSKYLQISSGKAQLIFNIIIVLSGGFVFGINIVIYSAIIIIIATSLVDKILIGISDSKMFFVYSEKTSAIKKFVIKELHAGITIFNTEGGFKKEPRQMLMIVVPTKDYYLLKETILTIDQDAFFVISDCYEVSGGVKRNNLPFF